MIKKLHLNSNDPYFTSKRVLELYTQLYDLYGDSFIFHIINMNDLSDKYLNLYINKEKNKIENDGSSNNFKIKSIEILAFNRSNKIEYLDAFENDYMPVRSKKCININFGKNLKNSNDGNIVISSPNQTGTKINIGKINKSKEVNYQHFHNIFL
jgi:hypothetical protein